MTLTFPKGKEFAKIFDAAPFQAALAKSMLPATQLNAKLAEAQLRKTIKEGDFAANAPLTVAIKGSSKPLVDHGDLFKAITSEVADNFTAVAGVLRTDDNYNIVRAIHDGTEIKVTDKMRGLFFVLWRASTRQIDPGTLDGRAAELFERFKEWRPLSASTSVIVIPPRKFVDVAFDAAGLRDRVKANWNMALQQAFHEVGMKYNAGG